MAKPLQTLTAIILSLALMGGASAHARGQDDSADRQGEAAISLSESQEKFIYLDDGSQSETAGSGLPFLDLDRAGAAAGLFGKTRTQPRPFLVIDSAPLGLDTSPIRIDAFALAPQQRSRIEVGYPIAADDAGRPQGFGVWLSSEIARSSNDFSNRFYALDAATVTPQRSYNLNLNVGYGRFALGAGVLRRDNSLLDPGYYGFDLGVGYFGDSWFTNIQFAGYRNDGGPLYFNFTQERKLHAVEIGAGYALWPWLTFSGQFKYFDYSNKAFPDLSADQEGVFSLDTKLNF